MDIIFLFSIIVVPTIFIILILGLKSSFKQKNENISLTLFGSFLTILAFYGPYHYYSEYDFDSGWKLSINQPLVFLVFLISFYIFVDSTIKSSRKYYNKKNHGIILLTLGIFSLSFIVFLIFTLEQNEFPFGLWGAFIGNSLIILSGIYEVNIKPKIIQEAIVEIEKLIQQLSQAYSIKTPEEKLAFVGKAIDEIQSNPELKTKISNALKAGGVEAIKSSIKHPIVNILMATLEGFQKTEDS